MKTFTIKIPSGIRNNEKVRLVGQGKEGKNGGTPGDLFIKINIINSTRFELEGYNLKRDLLISPWEAALGTRISIEGINEQTTIYIPAGKQSGEKISIPQKGYKDGKGGRGDLIIEIKITVPKQLTTEEKELLEKLQKISTYNPRIL